MIVPHGPREIVGTPYYQAPEIAAGRTPTAASDLYSFGVTLYEMLAGHVPFQPDSAGEPKTRSATTTHPRRRSTTVEHHNDASGT